MVLLAKKELLDKTENKVFREQRVKVVSMV
jgi:hypothetical protein